MTIKTATRIAAVGVAIGLAASLTYSIARMSALSASPGTPEFNVQLGYVYRVWRPVKMAGVSISYVALIVFFVLLKTSMTNREQTQ